MDLARLRTLRELSLRHTMAAVADALFLTPSAVSQQIAQLEDDVGMQLIEKRGRGVRLTPAGERLVGHAERLFSTLEEACADMAKLESEIAGTLRVAVFPTIGSSLLPPVIRAVEAAHPYLEIILEESEPAEALTALNSWHCDVAFIDDAVHTKTAAAILKVCRCCTMRYTLYCRPNTRLRISSMCRSGICTTIDGRWIQRAAALPTLY